MLKHWFWYSQLVSFLNKSSTFSYINVLIPPRIFFIITRLSLGSLFSHAPLFRLTKVSSFCNVNLFNRFLTYLYSFVKCVIERNKNCLLKWTLTLFRTSTRDELHFNVINCFNRNFVTVYFLGNLFPRKQILSFKMLIIEIIVSEFLLTLSFGGVLSITSWCGFMF